MKKKQEILKSLQLILFILITAAALFTICTDSALYQMVGLNPSVGVLCLLLWLTLGLSFVFIYVDFRIMTKLKKEYRELDEAVYHDHMAGIANRFSCDAIIEKYADKPIPEDVGCIMLDISNISAITNFTTEIFSHKHFPLRLTRNLPPKNRFCLFLFKTQGIIYKNKVPHFIQFEYN